MIDLIQSLLLSDILVFVALIGAFLYLSRRALDNREFTGYGLGWMIALFFIIVYISTGTRQDTTIQTDSAGIQLTFFQIAMPTLCGIVSSVGILALIGLAQSFPRRYTLLIALLVALNVTMIFLMFVVASDTRRMIGIFALAFGICAITISVLFGGNERLRRGIGAQSATGMPSPLDDQGGYPPQGGAPTLNPQSRLDAIREQFRRK